MAGYYKGDDSKCVKCETSCDKCYKNTATCGECKSKFHISSDGTDCGTGITCETGYYRKDETEGCVNCYCDSTADNTCTDGVCSGNCMAGYYKGDDSKCVKCGENCEECNDECTKCKTGYTIDANVDSTKKNCPSCDTYYEKNTDGECVFNLMNCKEIPEDECPRECISIDTCVEGKQDNTKNSSSSGLSGGAISGIVVGSVVVVAAVGATAAFVAVPAKVAGVAAASAATQSVAATSQASLAMPTAATSGKIVA